MDRIASAAEILFDMRLAQRKEAALPSDVVPQSIAEGYQVQESTVRMLLARYGGTPIGYKAACTSVLAQQQLCRVGIGLACGADGLGGESEVTWRVIGCDFSCRKSIYHGEPRSLGEAQNVTSR